jgi:hypothetical protein
MALKLVREQEQPPSPNRAALKDNLQAIRDTRALVMSIVQKDRAAASDVALANATAGQIATLTDEIDRLKADAAYAGASSPDTRKQEQQLQHLQQLHKTQSERARAATRIREKYSGDMASLNAVLSEHARQTTRLLWTALREDVLPSLAAEFLQKEQAFLDVHRRVFSAAVACDQIAVEQAYGQFVRSGNFQDTWIGRPEHDAFWPEGVPMPEAAQAKRTAYMQMIVTEAQILIRTLLQADAVTT